MSARDLVIGDERSVRSQRGSMRKKPELYVPAWPGLSVTRLFGRRRRTNLPFPMSAPRNMYFFRARNAIYHLVQSLGFVNGETILVPDYHSGSEVLAIRAAGASVRYFHIGRDLQPDLAQLRRLCESEKPRALLTIHYNGWSQPIEELVALCEERRMTLIEDCAHAMLSTNEGRPLGTYGHYSVFCLYKSVPVPNGAVLVCNGEVPEGLAGLELGRTGTLSLCGRTAELVLTRLRSRAPGLGATMFALKRGAGRLLDALDLARLPIGEVGFDTQTANAAISPLSLSLLEAFDYDEIVQRRRHNFLQLQQRLAGHADLVRGDLPEGMCPLFLQLLVADKPAAAVALRMRGVEAVEAWNVGDSEAQGPDYADAQFLRNHMLELPIHPDLTADQLQYMVDQVVSLELHSSRVLPAKAAHRSVRDSERATIDVNRDKPRSIVLRRLVKNAAAHAVSWTRLDALAQVKLHRRMPFAVAYHRVVERVNACGRFPLPAMEISAAMLERHLDWLGRRFRIVSLDDLTARLEERPGSKPLAVVTFDDGYSDIFHHAFPVLKRKGIPAGIFVVTDLVGTTELPVHERLHAVLVRAWSRWTSPRNDLSEVFTMRTVIPKAVKDPFSATRFLLATLSAAEVERVIDFLDPDHDIDQILPASLRPLSWEMLARMRDSGMTIASHSKTHAFLSNESTLRVREEAELSRSELERRLDVDVRCFAYPGGSFNASVVEAIASAGYHFGFTICQDRDRRYPMLTIPRTVLWEQSCLDPFGRFSQAIMSSQAAGTFRFMSRCTQHHTQAASL